MNKLIIICTALTLVLGSCKKNDRAFVVSKIQKASKLATTEVTIDKMVLATKDKKFLRLIPVNRAVFLAQTEAVIKTGIDLNELKEKDIEIEGDKITLRLPHARVVNFSYPAEKYIVDTVITQKAFLNKITIEDHEEFYRQAETDIRNNLKYLGIKKATEEKTRLLMENLLKNLGYREIYIEFDTAGELIQEVPHLKPQEDGGEED